MLVHVYAVCSFPTVLHHRPSAGVIKAEVGVECLCLLTGIYVRWYLLNKLSSVVILCACMCTHTHYWILIFTHVLAKWIGHAWHQTIQMKTKLISCSHFFLVCFPLQSGLKTFHLYLTLSQYSRLRDHWTIGIFFFKSSFRLIFQLSDIVQCFAEECYAWLLEFASRVGGLQLRKMGSVLRWVWKL